MYFFSFFWRLNMVFVDHSAQNRKQYRLDEYLIRSFDVGLCECMDGLQNKMKCGDV